MGKLENIIYFVLNKWKPLLNDEELLNLISDFFSVDLAVLYIVNFENFKFDSNAEYVCFLSRSIFKTEEEEKLKKIHFSGAFEESIKSKKVLNIRDYNTYSKAVKEWKEVGVRSVLTVPLIRDDDVVGCLQIAYVGSNSSFSKSDEENLILISDLLAAVIWGKINERKLILYESIEDIHLHISSSLERIANVDLYEWIVENMKYILDVSGAYVSGLIMPYDDIYCIVSVDDKFTICTNEMGEGFAESITYSLFEKKVNQPIALREAMEKYGFRIDKRVRSLGLKDGIYVPVEYDKKIVAFFSFGFRRRVDSIEYNKILLKNAGVHLFMAVMLFKRLESIKNLINENEEQFIKSLMKVAEARDTYTKGHSERVAYYARVIGEVLKKDERELNMLYTAGLMHDIGKIGIPDAILLKPGKLSKHEFEIVKYHPLFSYEIIKDVGPLSDIADCIKFHHERCDGSGYPSGLECDEIEFCAKVLAIADVFDALTSERSYRDIRKYSPVEALKMMKNMPLDKYILDSSKEALINHYKLEDTQETLLYSKTIDIERTNIFFKDYLTGVDRLSLFKEFVDEKIEKKERFALVVVDIINLVYINYSYGIDMANKMIEKLAEKLLSVDGVKRVMRDGADSFVIMCDDDMVKNVLFSVEQIDRDIRIEFLKDDKNYNSKLLYKAYVIFPKDGSSFEDLLYKLRLLLKQVRQYSSPLVGSF